MALFTWSEKFSVKIKSIDEQHRKLFELINGLHDAIQKGSQSAVSNKIVVELVNYTLQHFIYEENLLEENEYPGLHVQRKEHDELTDRVMKYKKTIESGGSVDLQELLDFMLGWLEGHILEEDMKYSAFLAGRGVK